MSERPGQGLFELAARGYLEDLAELLFARGLVLVTDLAHIFGTQGHEGGTGLAVLDHHFNVDPGILGHGDHGIQAGQEGGELATTPLLVRLQERCTGGGCGDLGGATDGAHLGG